jgi:ABC-type sugar transport system ATPase subunit
VTKGLQVVLEVRNLGKSFGNVEALKGVNLEIFESEIHAVLGQNGAGKSTLVKLMTGLYPTSSAVGEIHLNQKKIELKSVSDARKQGLAYVPQEIEIVDNLTVAENIFAGQIPDKKGLFSLKNILNLAEELNQKYSFGLPVHALAAGLSTAQRQTVMIARALASNPSVLLLDEPTTSLSKDDAATLAKNLINLKKNNVTMIYITHRIPEVIALCDRATVLRDGQVALNLERSEFSPEKIITAMIGHTLENKESVSKKQTVHNVLLALKGVSVPSSNPQQVALNNVNFELRDGEILGLAGLVGSGRSEILSAIAGRSAFSGSLKVGNQEITSPSPKKMRDRGIVILTEDRKREGLLFNLNLVRNVIAGSTEKFSKFGLVQMKDEYEEAFRSMESLAVKTRSYLAEPAQLSGGNQQKVLLARALTSAPKILLLDEPTKGVDVGARQEIYQIIRRIKDSGTGIIVVSSDLDELLLLSDRVVVVANGTTVDEFAKGEGDEARVLRFGTGLLQ